MVGFPVINYFTRMFIGYSYESLKIKDLNPFYNDPAVIQNNPYLADALLLGQNGRRTVSKVVPSIVYNTVDNPIFPTAGKKLTAAMDFAGLGGNTNFLRPTLEGIWYIPHTRRTSIGLRGQWMHIDPYGSTQVVPIVERLFLGGEYSVRGFDIRSIGPRDPRTGLVVGGISSLLFNAEYLIQIAGPVRLVIFYDAGQVPGLKPGPDVGFVGTPLPPLYGPQIPTLGTEYEKFKFSEFKTSTGAEIRFFMPVLNVPFRLIFAANPQRTGVYQNNGQPAKEFTFRFAVGSTF
jgi:outer membrane protein assembly factor BamA